MDYMGYKQRKTMSKYKNSGIRTQVGKSGGNGLQLDIDADANLAGEQGMGRCHAEGESRWHSLRDKFSLFLENYVTTRY